MDAHKPQINDYGGSPFAEHDVVCYICHEKKAVLDLNRGIFIPCWSCQKEGWVVIKRKKHFWSRNK